VSANLDPIPSAIREPSPQSNSARREWNDFRIKDDDAIIVNDDCPLTYDHSVMQAWRSARFENPASPLTSFCPDNA
jgi:hypothetical protein